MNKASILATTAFVAGLVPALDHRNASADEIVDNQKTAELVRNHILNNCPQTLEKANIPEKEKCTFAGLQMSYNIASKWDKYLSEIAMHTSSPEVGLARGDIKSSCLWPVQFVYGLGFSESEHRSFQNFLNATFSAVNACESSIARGGKEVGINYEPTARNIISCHMNRIKGYNCQKP